MRFAGLMTMPPLAAEPEEARPHFAAPAGAGASGCGRDWAPRHDFAILSMGTSQDFEVAVEEGATIVPAGQRALRVARVLDLGRKLQEFLQPAEIGGSPKLAVDIRPRRSDYDMALRDTWHRALHVLRPRRGRALRRRRRAGDDFEPEAELEERYRTREQVRRVGARRRDEIDDIFADDAPPAARRPACCARSATAAPADQVRVHLVVPKNFNDAQQIADKFKDSIPVILNLQGADTDLSKRLIDFASGLTYALDGGMQRIADKVFLLTPRNVEVSAEERARLLEKGFFNQS